MMIWSCTQMNYSKYYPIYASGSTPYQLTDKKPLPYSEQTRSVGTGDKGSRLCGSGRSIRSVCCLMAEILPHEDNDSYCKYFRPFAEKYHLKGALQGMGHP